MASSSSQGALSFTARMARWSARHRWRVVIAWVVLVVAALFVTSAVGTDTDIGQGGTGESQEVIDLLEDRFGEEQETGGFQEIVVFEHPSLTVDDPVYQETVEGLLAELRALRVEEIEVVGGTTVISESRIVSGTTSHFDIGAPREQSPFVAQNETGGDVTLALVDLEGDEDEVLDNVGAVLDAVAEFEPPEGFAQSAAGDAILIGGDASLLDQQEEIINEDFARAGLLNLPVTFGILILAFGAVVVALVPLALAFTAIFVALGLLAIISQASPMAEVFSEIVLLLGLATGIDYSLFVVSRFRSERRAGRSLEEALLAASGTSGKAVVFAGVTVLLALTGLFFLGDVIFTSLGIAAVVVVGMAILVSVTLLPALLSLLGDNVNRLRVPFLGRPGEGGGMWGFIADRVLARPA
ncbi:MAG: MMPL family transporter, partial [Thermoanaerobaculia bacterium]